MGATDQVGVSDRPTFRVVGQGVPRLDSADKVRGLAQYADDLPFSSAWHGRVVRSPVSHGRLRGLQFDAGFDWSQVVVVTPEDIPGENVVDMPGRDMPFLADDEIRYKGEPVALVAAPTKRLANEAAAAITVDVEERPALYTLEEIVEHYKHDRESLEELASQTIHKGDVDAALEQADHVVEGEYWCGHQEQLYIEPQGMVAQVDDDGGVFVQGSMQCPYYINPELCVTLNVPREKLRVKQSAVGGGFGGKEEYPTLIAGYCALLAMKARRPVKIVFDRHEDILYTTKRHPAWVRYKTGLSRDGKITAMHVEYVLDGGAYTTLSPVVMHRGILHAAMGYRCDNVAIDGHVFRTHTFPNGAFRGFGAPQAIWGLESHIDELAETCGMRSHEFRLKNFLRDGDTTPTKQLLNDSVGSEAVLTDTLERSQFAEKLQRCSHGNPDEARWYGIGMSFFAHGSGFTGDGEAKLNTRVALELDRFEDGRPGVHVRASSTEMGQGTFTILAQAAAEGLSIGYDRVDYPYPDTSLVPDSGPTVASRTAMVVGNAVYNAGLKMKAALEDHVARQLADGQRVVLDDSRFRSDDGREWSFDEVAESYLKHIGPMRVEDRFRLPPDMRWNQETFEGDAYPSYSWGCNVAEVDVDPLTYEVNVKRVTAVYDIGRVMNPITAKGQLEGGLVQALGYAIMEKMGIQDGRYDADRMQTYVIPTMVDCPEFDLDFVEFPYEAANPGAKGVGEIPMDGLAPAIANALKRATGVRFHQIPITPEAIFEAMENGSQAKTELSGAELETSGSG